MDAKEFQLLMVYHMDLSLDIFKVDLSHPSLKLNLIALSI